MYHKNPATFNYSRLKTMVNVIISAVSISTAPHNYECNCTFFYSIDASDSERLGKYVNDAPKKNANCVAKSAFVCGMPRVLLFAAKDIPANMELRYHYGGKKLPWRDSVMVTASEVNVPQKGDANCLSAGNSGNALCLNPGDGDLLGLTKSSRTCRMETNRRSELFQVKLQKDDGNGDRSRKPGKQKRRRRLIDYTANADAFEHSMQKIGCMDLYSAKVADNVQHKTAEAIDDMVSDAVMHQGCSSDTCSQNMMGPELPVMSASGVFVLKTGGYMETAVAEVAGDEKSENIGALDSSNTELILQQGSVIDVCSQNSDGGELLATSAAEASALEKVCDLDSSFVEVVDGTQCMPNEVIDVLLKDVILQQGCSIDAC
jgi:hypothetical protein